MTDIIADTGRGEQLVLDVRSSAPSSPETHQAWIRDDLTSGEQIGALEFGDGTQVPIYPDSLTVEDSVTKALQVSVGGQMGFIPTAPVDDATYDARRFPYNGVDYGLHSARKIAMLDIAIPDSGGTHQWNHLENGGTTLGDSIGTLDATINGATWTSGLGTGGGHLVYDGANDDSVLSGGASEFTHFTDAGTGTFFTWITPDTLADSRVILGSTATTTEVGAYFLITGGDLRCSLYYGTNGVETQAKASYPASAGEWAPVAFTADGSTLKVWAGDPITEIASDTLEGTTGSDWSNDPYFGYGPLTDYRHDGGMDLTFTDSDAWTQSELQSFVDDSREFYS